MTWPDAPSEALPFPFSASEFYRGNEEARVSEEKQVEKGVYRSTIEQDYPPD